MEHAAGASAPFTSASATPPTRSSEERHPRGQPRRSAGAHRHLRPGRQGPLSVDGDHDGGARARRRRARDRDDHAGTVARDAGGRAPGRRRSRVRHRRRAGDRRHGLRDGDRSARRQDRRARATPTSPPPNGWCSATSASIRSPGRPRWSSPPTTASTRAGSPPTCWPRPSTTSWRCRSCSRAAPSFARRVAAEVTRQVAELPRRAIAERSLVDQGAIFVVDSDDEMVDAMNRLAPEHAELAVRRRARAGRADDHRGRAVPGRAHARAGGRLHRRARATCCPPAAARASRRRSAWRDFVKRTSIIEYDAAALAAQARRHRAADRRRGAGRPRPRGDHPDPGRSAPMNLAATLRGTTYRFRDLKEVLGQGQRREVGRSAGRPGRRQRLRADRRQARAGRGDAAASSTKTRSCRPSSDAVTRLILDDLQRPIYDSVKSWTVAKLREHVLSDATRRGGAAAAVARPDQRDDRRLRQADDQPRPRLRRAQDPGRGARHQHRRAAGPALGPPAAQPPVRFDRGDHGLAARRAVVRRGRRGHRHQPGHRRSRNDGGDPERHAATSCGSGASRRRTAAWPTSRRR